MPDPGPLRPLSGAVVLFAVVVAAAGCTGSSGPSPAPAATTTAPSVSVSPSTSISPSPVVTTVTPAATPTGTAVAACPTSTLELSTGDTSGAAGTLYEPLILTNNGTTTCSLYGYPGVSFVDSAGHQLGLPASRTSGTPHTVVLHPGDAASALLGIPNPGVFAPSQCHPATADRIKVYPPGQTVPLLVNQHNDVCTTQQGRAHIGVMKAGTSGM